MKLEVLLAFLILLFSCGVVHAADNACPNSSHDLASQFYKWYVPIVISKNSAHSLQIAMEKQGSQFESGLLAALKEDVAAQAAAKGEIVGLDFDPFLNTQDPAESYEVGQ